MSDAKQYPVESHLTPIAAHTFSESGDWWRAIVHAEDHYGNEKVRLYLWHNNGSDWKAKHKWNITPDRWPAEKRAGNQYAGAPLDSQTPHFPVQHYTVVGGQTIEKTDKWWTAVVQYEDNWSATHKTRFYLWELEDEEPKGTGYKWNIKTDTWPEERTTIDRYVTKLG